MSDTTNTAEAEVTHSAEQTEADAGQAAQPAVDPAVATEAPAQIKPVAAAQATEFKPQPESAAQIAEAMEAHAKATGEQPAPPKAEGGEGGPKVAEIVDHKAVEMTLDEASAMLSREGESVEMIGAFRHEMRHAKEPKLKALEAHYRGQFAEFHKRECR